MVEELTPEEATREFETEFKAGKFHLTLSQNTAKVYDEEEERLDSQAVEDFLESALFSVIKDMH
jgi:hypothetical protein